MITIETITSHPNFQQLIESDNQSEEYFKIKNELINQLIPENLTLNQFQQQITNLLQISNQKLQENETLIEQREHFPQHSPKYFELERKRLIIMQIFFIIGDLILELKSKYSNYTYSLDLYNK